MILRQLLSQMYPRPQVLLPHRGAPSFSLNASYPSPTPSCLCMLIKISKGDHFFSSWRYLYCLLVPGLPGCMKFWVNVAFCLPTEGRRTQFFHPLFTHTALLLCSLPLPSFLTLPQLFPCAAFTGGAALTESSPSGDPSLSSYP